MNIVISGSSFLVPRNKGWQSLGEQNTLDFADYGSWSSALIKTHIQDALVLVLFLDDLIDLRRKDEAEVRPMLDTVLSLLDRRLDRAQAPTILCFSTGDDGHAIMGARSPSKKAVISQWFFGEVYALTSQHAHLYLVDLDHLIGLRGREASLDARNWYLAHCRLSSLGLSILGDTLMKVLRRHYAPASKILVLDCDNTIWGGVIGEDGVEGLVLGQDGLGLAYVDFQAVAKNLARQGVILALASKNNEAEVWQVFDQHGAMELQRADIVAWKINWQEKAENIRELAEELDLGLDSFVFWDDNPIERDKMRHKLPDVLTVDVNQDVFEWPRQLANLDCFAKFSVTSDDIKKTEQYHNRARFVRDKNVIEDEIAYLKSIKLQPLAHSINPDNISRAAQLCAKTNQYNLRSIRHNQGELSGLVKLNAEYCYLVSLSDIYGEHGIVGLVCMRELDANTLFLDTFLMSCRVLGRHLEAWMLHHALLIARKHSYKNIVGEFIPTKRNTVAEGFFGDHGFMPLTQVDQLGSISKEVWTTIYSHSISSSSRLYVISTQTLQLPYREIYEKN